jgi:hypothetical protein
LHDHVQPEVIVDGLANSDRLFRVLQRRIHDDQQIDIALRPGMTARIEAKQDDFLRLELFGDLLRGCVDGPPGNAAALIDVGNFD